MLRRGPARLAEEGEEDEPPAVEAGEQGREQADAAGEATDRGAAGEGRLDDGVLRTDAGEAEDADDTAAGESASCGLHGPAGQRDGFPAAAGETHVVLVEHSMDHH